MSNNQDPLESAGKGGEGSVLTDRDYGENFKHKSARPIIIAACFLTYASIIITLWLLNIKLLAILLTLIINTILLLSWLAHKIANS